MPLFYIINGLLKSRLGDTHRLGGNTDSALFKIGQRNPVTVTFLTETASGTLLDTGAPPRSLQIYRRLRDDGGNGRASGYANHRVLVESVAEESAPGPGTAERRTALTREYYVERYGARRP